MKAAAMPAMAPTEAHRSKGLPDRDGPADSPAMPGESTVTFNVGFSVFPGDRTGAGVGGFAVAV
jgi:hypothetical protein